MHSTNPSLISRKFERLQKAGVSPGNLKILYEFEKYLRVVGGNKHYGALSEARRLSYLNTIGELAIKTSKPLRRITKANLIDYFAELEAKGLSPATMVLTRINVKRFFKWALGFEDEDTYPKPVKWIYTGSNGNADKSHKHPITPAEVKQLVEHAPSLKYQCLVGFVYETACRIGEALALKIGDLKTDRYGFYVKLQQTKNRNESVVRLINCAPTLTAYLSQHRKKEDANAPLFIADLSDEPLSYVTAAEALGRIQKQAKLQNHISWHCMRHGRLTQLANEGWGDREIMGISGHKTHRMVGEYVKIRDVRKKQLIEAGILDKDGNAKDETLKPVVCKRCKHNNPPTAMFCARCSLLLDEGAIKQPQHEVVDAKGQKWTRVEGQMESLYRRLFELERKLTYQQKSTQPQ